MQQDNKILISAILIIGIGLVSFNFLGGISGKATAETAFGTIVPEKAECGSYDTSKIFTFIPGKDMPRVENKGYVKEENSERRVQPLDLCHGDSLCYPEEIDFRMSCGVKGGGEYYVEGTGRDGTKYKSKSFRFN